MPLCFLTRRHRFRDVELKCYIFHNFHKGTIRRQICLKNKSFLHFTFVPNRIQINEHYEKGKYRSFYVKRCNFEIRSLLGDESWQQMQNFNTVSPKLCQLSEKTKGQKLYFLNSRLGLKNHKRNNVLSLIT